MKTIPERKDISADDRWDLTPLFHSDREWEKLFAELGDSVDAYDKYKGCLHESAAVLHEALEFHLSISRRIERLYTYAHLKKDEDQSNQHYLGLYQRVMNLYTQISEAASFITPEVQSIPDDLMSRYKSEDLLAEYDFFLEKIIRYKPHTRTEAEEQLLAMSQELAQAPSQVFSQLDNVDLDFGTITDADGIEVELSHGNFSTFLINPDRNIRQKAFMQYYRAYQNHENTVAATFVYSNKKDVFYARARHFSSCRAQGLFSDDVPESVYDNLVETVRGNLQPLFKYLDFRRQALKLTELHFYDTYVPLAADVDFRMPYREAVTTAVNALAPLGTDYIQILEQGLLGGWVDRYENRGKRSGAYSSGCYDSPPYILLNYEENNLNSLYTLVHEAGHSMHSFYSRKHQPYVDHDYTIFVAEVASTLNEDLLSRYLLQHYENDSKMKIYILNREIDNIRATLFRQTMFAEFEKTTHDIVENNEPLTREVIVETYNQLLQVYFGNTMVIDPELALECLRIPHFYSPFYVYKYATGISAAIALAENIYSGSTSEKTAYIDFLKLGGSKFPLDALSDAGVDMRSPEPVLSAIQHFETLVDRLIEAYDSI